MCDIQHMFYDFYVIQVIEEYCDSCGPRMTTWKKKSSNTKWPSTLFEIHAAQPLLTFALRKLLKTARRRPGSTAKRFVHTYFYVDEGLTSTPSVSEAITLIKDTQEVLSTANIRLQNVVSNFVDVMESFSAESRIDSLRDFNLQVNPIPFQRSLGVHWDIIKDAFTFSISLPDKPFTRRGVVAIVTSIYDLLTIYAS